MKFWEKEYEGTLSKKYKGDIPLLNDLVTFIYDKNKILILTLEKEIRE